MIKKLLFNWKYTVYGDRSVNPQKPLILEGCNSFTADAELQMYIIKETMIAYVKNKCKQRVEDEFSQYDSIIESDSVEIFNVREENVWSSLEDLTK
jgi:hypothetical protein